MKFVDWWLAPLSWLDAPTTYTDGTKMSPEDRRVYRWLNVGITVAVVLIAALILGAAA